MGEQIAVTLSIKLMGPFVVARDGLPAEGFDSDKVRALLAYLAVEEERPHRRESLAGFLWPEMPERSARGNLRSALANLRHVIGDREASPAYLEITRQTLRFNPGSSADIDVRQFEADLSSREIDRIASSIELYRGEFLEGFSIADSPEFERWMRLQHEHLQQLYLGALATLADYHEAQTDYMTAVDLGRRELRIEPWLESGHRRVMRNLALAGKRDEALAQYELCQKTLSEELDVEPSAETTELYERIRAAALEPAAMARKVRGYELHERIGTGSFGVIYRAHQPSVGREVAIKVIRPEFANDPRFIRNFEAEAQLVARLEHPHIVPLYDYWRDPEGAYLVMRWFRTGSLEAALKRGPYKPDRALSLIDQIASALAAAHRQGVVHGDLKPANVLIDEEGNGYLSDFGIAIDLEGLIASGAGPGVTGTPGYSSPEQIRGERADHAADIYALGVILYEVLIAEPPFKTDTASEQLERHLTDPLPSVADIRPDLPSAVDSVIQKATRKDPARRYSDVVHFVQALHQAFAGGEPTITSVAERNPYKGLRAFQEVDAPDYFGREELIGTLVQRLGEGDRFLALVGPSGSGKSSVARAGLIPALRGGKLPGAEEWFFTKMFPGSDPFEELEAALLRIAINPPDSLMEQLEADDNGLRRAIKRVLQDESGELLLVIDQFEELFTLDRDDDAADHFLDSLLAAVTDPRSGLRVVVTLRADYYDRPLQHQAFGKLMKAGTEVILPMGSAELERAIAAPAEQLGVTYDADLLATLVGDTLAEPGALPLLQYALTELFEQRNDGRLSLEAYRQSGGVAGALVTRAEALYQELDPAGKGLVQHIFLRLLTVGEATEERRRRVERSELASLGEDPKQIDHIVDSFGDHRLLTFDRDPETRAPTVEIAHEALIRKWGRVRNWIIDNREDLILQRRLAAAASEWLQSDRDPGFLLRGSRLQQFDSWRTDTSLILNLSELEYLQESISARELRRNEEAARQVKEDALERRAVNRLRVAVVVLAVGIVASTVLSLFANNQSQAAQDQARISTARELAAASRASLDIDPELGILLALQAIDTTREEEGSVLPVAEEALHLALARSRLRSWLSLDGTFCSIQMHPDGSRLILWDCGDGESGTTRVWDLALDDSVLTLPDSAYPVLSFDGRRIATTGPDSERSRALMSSWDLSSGEQDWELELPDTGDVYSSVPFRYRFANLAVYGFEVDSSWSRAARLLGNRETEVWDLATGTRLFVLTGEFRPLDLSASFSPNSAWLATGSFDGSVSIWDAETGERIQHLEGHRGPVDDLEFSSDGNLLATASADGKVIIWDPTTGVELASLDGHTDEVLRLEFSQSGKLLATGGWDRMVIVWDVPASISSGSGKIYLSLPGHSEQIVGLSFSEDESLLASGSLFGEVRVWDVTRGGSGEGTVYVHGEGQGTTVTASVDLAADGSRLATASSDHTPRVWDVVSGQSLHSLAGREEGVGIIDLSADGELAATVGKADTIMIWSIDTGDAFVTIRDFPCGKQLFASCDVAFSPDGAMLAAGSDEGKLAIIDASTLLGGHPEISFADLKPLSAHSNSIGGVEFNPDGTQIVTTSWEGIAKLWDVASQQVQGFFATSFSADYRSAFSPDGSRLAVTNQDGAVRIWDLETRERMYELRGHAGSILGVDFSPDGQQIATAGFDGALNLWNAETGEFSMSLAKQKSGISDVVFSPDGTRLYAASVDGVSRVYLLDIDELIAVARERLSRDFSEEECRRYLHLEACPSDD